MKTLVFFLSFTLSLCRATANADVSLDVPNSEKWFKISGAPTTSYSGRVVSNIGDFNGDGIDDIILNSAFSGSFEVVYVIYGQKNGYSKDTIWVNSTYSEEGFAIKGPSINLGSSFFGWTVSKAVDLNGDGLGDIVIGSYGFSSSQGIVYVIYGKKGHTGDITINQDLTLSSSNGFIILGSQASQFGYSVSSAGDFNGDGFDDLLVGAPGYQSFMGAAYIIYGKKGNYANIYLNETSTPQQVFTIYGSTGTTCRFGMSVEGVRDINGDDVDDIFVGASGCYSFYGLYGKKNRAETTMTIDPSSFDTIKGFVISSAIVIGNFGLIMSSAGDINGDGIQDIILGTYAPSAALSRGAYVFYGRKENWASFEVDSGYASNLGFMIKDSTSGVIACGVAVSGGDINGDGLDDILVRARSGMSLTSGGYVAVIYGSQTTFTGIFDISTNLTADKGFLVSGSELNLAVTTKSIAKGDLNGDNIDDVIIGAPQSGATGEAYVVFGFNGCPTNCSSCFATNCLSCFEGYGLYNSSCGTCPVGTFLSGERICQECPETCSRCTSSSKCQACADGYTLSSSQSCEDQESKSQETQTAVSTGLFDGASAISNALAIGSSVPTNFGLVAKILRNTKYLNVTVSEELQKTFNSWKISTGVFPAPTSDSSDFGSLPLMFERYEMDKAFLMNYWKSLMMILIGLGLFVICKGTEIIFTKNSSVQKITRTGNVVASNFLLTQFYGSIDDILLYSVIDVRSGEFTSSGFRSFGFIFGWLLLLVGIGVTGLHGVVLYRYQRLKKQRGENQQMDFLMQFLKKYENLKLFFQDFKDIDVFQQAFLLINIVRSLLSSFIFTMLFRYPLLQILLLTALNVCILVFLFTKKPFKDLANTYAQYFCESVLLLAYLSILVLAIMDESKSESSKGIDGFSMVVIVSNMALLVGSAVFMLANIGQILHEMYKERRQKKSDLALTKDAVVLIPPIRSRVDFHQKIVTNVCDDISAEHSLKPNNTTHDYSNSLNTSDFNLIQNDSFQGNSSPNMEPRRRIRRDTVHRSTQSPAIKPSSTNHIPDPSMHSSPFALNVPGNLQLDRANSSINQTSFRLNPEGIQEVQSQDQNNSVLETSQFEAAKTRNRGYSVPMKPLPGKATPARGLPVVMEREEIKFDSKRTGLEKAPNNPSISPSSFPIKIPSDLQSEQGDSSFMQLNNSQSSFWMNSELTQNNFVLQTAQLESRTRNRGYSVPMRTVHERVTRDGGLPVVMEGEEGQFDSRKPRIKKIRR